MYKIAIIYSFKDSDWLSCVKIVKNLLKAYQKLENIELVPINYDEKSFQENPYQTVDILNKLQADKIIFLDHRPHPYFLLQKYLKNKTKYDAEIIFHIYGDFSLHFNLWERLNSLLIGKKVKFICSSDRQVKLIDKFLAKDQSHIVFKVPFPVDHEEFYYKTVGEDVPKKYNLNKNDKILLFTGRLSIQKNILSLIKVFEKYQLEANDRVTLVFAGTFDDLGFPFADIYHHQGEFFRIFTKTMDKIDSKVKDKIKFIGHVKNENLYELYNYAHGFVSFSTYHDEDYGMSVAEAGSCGCPLLLTDWAGFHSFLISDDYTFGIETKLTEEGPTFNHKKALVQFKDLVKLESVSRKALSEKFINHFGIDHASTLIKKILVKEVKGFDGFNELMIKLGREQRVNSKVFFDPKNRKMNKFYKKVYNVYTTDKKT